jgi:hypothetical protein
MEMITEVNIRDSMDIISEVESVVSPFENINGLSNIITFNLRIRWSGGGGGKNFTAKFSLPRVDKHFNP